MYGQPFTVFRLTETHASPARTSGRWESHCWPNRRREHGHRPTDDDLIALTLTGRSDAFGTLVERYERAVYHLAFRTMREVEEAKDAAQEAWIKAYRALASFRPGRSSRPGSSRSATASAATGWPSANGSRRGAGRLRGPGRARRAPTKRPKTPPACAPRSNRCPKNTGSSSPSSIYKASNTRKSPPC